MLAPGQGSQTPGMLTPWLDLPGVRDQLATWSKLTRLDLERLGTTATAEEITDTAVTQPLVVAAALLAFDEFSKGSELPADAVIAGHSVGELAAAAIKNQAKGAVGMLPDALQEGARRAKEMLKGMAVGGTLFEELGFSYIGPVDGHDMEQLLPLLRTVRARADGRS